jgi:hypothetical protein
MNYTDTHQEEIYENDKTFVIHAGRHIRVLGPETYTIYYAERDKW